MSTSSSFATTLIAVSTVQTVYTPTVQLPSGTLYWRVRAKSSSGTSGWAVAQFDRAPINIPTLTAPDDGKELSQPDDPVILGWNSVPGATAYTIQIGNDQLFTDPALYQTYSSKAPTFLLSTQQAPATYYWRVRATLAVNSVSEWSDARSYQITAATLPPEPLAPNDDADQAVTDVDLDWAPIPGATTYDLQVSTDVNFLSSSALVLTQTGITGTRYTRPATLNNDQYYWRVRPVDAAGHPGDWNVMPVWKFRRNWPDQPQLQYPADGATVGDPLYFQWTSTPHASQYSLQISQDSVFSNPATCLTTNTTYTPLSHGQGCRPGAEGTYYWRVLARDQHTSDGGPVTEDINAVVHTFTYSPESVQQIAPTDGASVSIPTMRWQPVSGAANYKVTYTKIGGSAKSVTTAALAYTPRAALTVGATYRWEVHPVSADGREGATLLAMSQPTFTVTAQDPAVDSTPEPTTADAQSYNRFPTLSWTPVVGADSYQMRIRKAGATGWTNVAGTFDYPAGEELTGSHLSPDNYEWQIDAYNGSTFLSSGSTGTFTIAAPAAVTGYRAALIGTDLHSDASQDVAGKTCNASLPANCSNLRNTPVLRWDPVPNAGFYRIYLAHDAALTNPIDQTGAYVDVYTNEWTPDLALPDSNAASATFWYVQACLSGSLCPAKQAATHSFNQQSNPIRPTAPADGSNQADDVTLSWQDYLASSATEGTSDTAITTPARTEARYYHLQVSTSPTFTSGILDNVVVDQPFFTSYANTYPEGNIYWRVQAFDGSENPLNWSAPQLFHKQSPTASLVSPAVNAQFQQKDVFRWQALPYAKSYIVEVFRNDGNPPSTSNKVAGAGGTTQQIAFAPSTPLAPGSYRWRVTRTDAKGRAGAPSALIDFKVVDQGVSQTAPSAGTTWAFGARQRFQWAAVTGSAKYRWEYRAAGTTTRMAYVDTAALAWAPVSRIAAGSWEWRVSALDASGQTIGTSTWREFAVSAPPLAHSTSPTISGTPRYGLTLTASPGTWTSSPTFTYQWLRDGTPINAATSAKRQVVTADVGHRLSVRVTATKSGYASGSATSASLLASRAVSTTVTKLVDSTVKRGSHANATLYVTAPGVAYPSGKIRLYSGTQWLKTVTLYKSQQGHLTTALPLLAVGSHYVHASYLGDTYVGPSRSTSVKLTIYR